MNFSLGPGAGRLPSLRPVAALYPWLVAGTMLLILRPQRAAPAFRHSGPPPPFAPGQIEFPAPNENSRVHILKIHSRKMNLTRGINLRKIAELMPGASGAELKGVCTEAGMYALRERRVHVTQEDFELAQAKIMQKDSEKNMSLKKFFT